MSSTKPLRPIFETPGFQNVAYAIRHSTITPQYWKAEIKHGRAQGREQLYEVRYGLGAELKRKSTMRDEFIEALTNFMQSYNQENSQVRENKSVDPRRQRKYLRNSDLNEVFALVDEYGSELIAGMLVAYGYSLEQREENQNE